VISWKVSLLIKIWFKRISKPHRLSWVLFYVRGGCVICIPCWQELRWISKVIYFLGANVVGTDWDKVQAFTVLTEDDEKWLIDNCILIIELGDLI
jgi:hypothetical protein